MANSHQCMYGNEAPELLLSQLSASQAGSARHKCAVCAYSLGYSAGAQAQQPWSAEENCQHAKSAPTAVLASLPDSQAGPGLQRHKCCVCAYREGFEAAAVWADIPHGDDVSSVDTFYEGAVKTVTVNAYERNHVARQRCIEHHGDKCSVCGFHFELRYGPVGKGLIHVHHLRPLAEIGQAYKVDPVKDLRPVCPNCHAMLHRREPPYTIDELSAMLRTG